MRTRPLRQAVWLGALAGAVVAGGCGGGDTPTGPATPLPSYLARYRTTGAGAVYFIQWQRRDDSVEGTLTVAVPTATDTPTRKEPVTGEIDGDRITLEVGADPPQRWEGQRVGPTIVFSADLAEGIVQTLRFVPASLAAYRQAVAALREPG